ncbi:hypothetical protein [Tepidibacter hydrothermalis]|uniref:FERM C-terminal PH-like domain-containing protein n=1 Tax=Tepidibacter hydrothermalis TaxID=3036126 RepID=A0ABY8EK41_9FIRM|nr:hypothetical protein [Tepidibacter hydrothermalis]WFD11505.1 hypothetical protein P4S50_05365 [Tepidibacter hydrothermalis]
MENIYIIDKKKTIIFVLIFLLAASTLTYISIKDNIEDTNVVQEYGVSTEQGSFDILENDLIEKMDYNRASQNHNIGILRTIIICGIELTILWLCFLKNIKIGIDQEGIKVYSVYKKKPTKIYNWDEIENISFQYGEDIRGFIPSYGMKIKMIRKESDFIPIKKFLNNEEISNVVMNYYDNVELSDNSEESYGITELLKDSYKEYKNGFNVYIKYSLIVLTFALLKELIQNPIVALIVLIANIVLGYRALIALNYKAYMSYNGENIDFDTGWEFAKDKIGRYFGASLVLEIPVIIFIGIGYFFITSSLEFNYKVVLSIVLGIVCIFSISRIYLITYIASIIDTDKSYMSLNGIVIKKYYKQVMFMFIVSSLRIAPIVVGAISDYKNLNAGGDMIEISSYIITALDLFLIPFISCYFMRILKDLPVRSGDSYNE